MSPCLFCIENDQHSVGSTALAGTGLVVLLSAWLTVVLALVYHNLLWIVCSHRSRWRGKRCMVRHLAYITYSACPCFYDGQRLLSLYMGTSPHCYSPSVSCSGDVLSRLMDMVSGVRCPFHKSCDKVCYAEKKLLLAT